MNDQAWLDGQKNGRIDRLRGAKNEHAWIVLLNEGYSRSYSLGIATVGHVRMRGHCENSKLDTGSNLLKS